MNTLLGAERESYKTLPFNSFHYAFFQSPISSPDGLTTQVISTSHTSLTISWTLEQPLRATAYTISYINTNTRCFSHFNTISGISGGRTSHELHGLQEGTVYTINVTALLNEGGGIEKDTIRGTTRTAG